jgi:hypothetical protein
LWISGSKAATRSVFEPWGVISQTTRSAERPSERRARRSVVLAGLLVWIASLVSAALAAMSLG